MMSEAIQVLPDKATGGALPSGPSKVGPFPLLIEIIEKRQLIAHFQPIISMPTGKIIGYEGLIRGPSDSPLHSPLSLFKAAGQCGLALELERLCRQVTLETFVRLQLAVPQCQPRMPAAAAFQGRGNLGLHALARIESASCRD